jgi:hypothetical protein
MFFSKAYTDQESRLSPGFSQINKDAQHRFSQTLASLGSFIRRRIIIVPRKNRIILLPATFEKGTRDGDLPER